MSNYWRIYKLKDCIKASCFLLNKKEISMNKGGHVIEYPLMGFTFPISSKVKSTYDFLTNVLSKSL